MMLMSFVALYGEHYGWMDSGELYSQLMQQVMAVSIKELWGITIMVCILLFAIMLLFDSPAVAAMR